MAFNTPKWLEYEWAIDSNRTDNETGEVRFQLLATMQFSCTMQLYGLIKALRYAARLLAISADRYLPMFVL